jgi:hypothetical protein
MYTTSSEKFTVTHGTKFSFVSSKFNFHNNVIIGYYIVACRPTLRQQPRNKQLYNSRCYATPPQTNPITKIVLYQRNGVFCGIRAEMLQAELVS